MIKLLPIGVFATLASVSAAAAADVGPSGGTLLVPWGDWLALAFAWSRDLVVAGLGALSIWIAPGIARQYLTDKVLGRAVDYALGAVEGAARGQTLTISVASEVLRVAAAYAITNAPGLVAALGETLRPKLFARIAAIAPVAGMPADAALPAAATKLRSSALVSLLLLAVLVMSVGSLGGCANVAAIENAALRTDAYITAHIPSHTTIAAACTLADAADGYFQTIAAEGKFNARTMAREKFVMEEIHRLCARPPANSLAVLKTIWTWYVDVQALTTVPPPAV